METTKPLTKREKMTIHLVLFLIKVIKPFNYNTELDKALAEFDILLRENI